MEPTVGVGVGVAVAAAVGVAVGVAVAPGVTVAVGVAVASCDDLDDFSWSEVDVELFFVEPPNSEVRPPSPLTDPPKIASSDAVTTLAAFVLAALRDTGRADGTEKGNR